MAAGDALLLTSQFVAAALFVLLAVTLLAVRFNSRVNRAFAIFLFLRGVTLFLQVLGRVPGNEDIEETLFNVARYFTLATPFVLLYFVVLYRSPNGGLLVRAIGIVALLAVLVLETVYLVDHCTFSCPGSPYGPITPFVQAIPLAEGVAGLVLALTARELAPDPRARSVVLVAASLTLLGLLEGAQIVSLLVTDGVATFTRVDLWLAVARAGPLVGFVASIISVALLLPLLSYATGRKLFVAAAIIVVATTLLQLHLEDAGEANSQVLSMTTFLFGTWRLLAAALVAYALVRHRFLDLDLRINWTISRGTVLAVLLATFMVVFQVVENALDQMLGVIFGGVATGLMLLALRPLERLGDRVAATVHPRGSPDLKADHRLAIFQEQATLVWADGHIGRKERLLLDNLRERLGIDAKVAANVEHDAAIQSGAQQNHSRLSSRS